MKYLNFLKENKFIIGILLIASFLRLYKLDFQSIWLDEIYTMKMTDPGISFSKQFLQINEQEGFPYLYFIILKILHSIFEYSPIVGRLFSAFFGVLGVFMLYQFGKLLFNKNTGLIAALITCFSEFAIFTSQDARPYSFYFFAVIVAFYYLVIFLRNITLKNAVFYGLSCGLLLNTNFFSLVNLFAHFLIILLMFYFSENSIRKVLFKNSAVSATIALLLFLPNYRILKKLMGFESGWIPAPTSDSLTLIFKEIFGNSEIIIFIITPLFFYYLFDVFRAKITKYNYHQIIENKNVFGFIILGFWMVILIAIIYIKSYADTSIMIARYFVSILPVFILVIAVSINLINTKIVKGFVVITLCFFMFSNLVYAKEYYTKPIKTQFREATSFVKENYIEGEKVYTGLKYFFDYFFESETKFKIEEKQSLETVFNEMQLDSTQIKSFWYVEAHSRPFVLSEKTKLFLEEKFFLDKSFDGLDAWVRHYVIKKDSFDVIEYKEDINNKIVRGWFDQFDYDGNNLVINGWAFIEGIESKESKIDIVLFKDNKATIIPTTNYSRKDVTEFINNGLNLDNSGYSVKTNLKNIEKGQYKIAIRIINLKQNNIGVFTSDKIIDVIN